MCMHMCVYIYIYRERERERTESSKALASESCGRQTARRSDVFLGCW